MARSISRRCPSSTIVHGAFAVRYRATSSIGFCVADNPSRRSGASAICCNRSSVSARCAPRRVPITAWISSTMTVRTVIVDEIHAVIGTRRGAHLALTLERLQQIAEAPLLRLGLSATQKPIEEVARNLTANAPCTIVDEGHRREMDLAIETPRSALEAVMSHEVWEEYYNRLTALIEEHRTTLVFVNTRRMAERVARHLSDRLGE